jgi:hypothetical protein
VYKERVEKSTMKRFLFTIMLIALLTCPFRGQAGAVFADLPVGGATPLSFREFHVDSQNIHIHV